MASPKAVDGGDQALLSEYAAAQKVAVTAPTAPRQIAWPYEDFGTPGKVVETKEITDLDTVFVRFENGVRLTIKPTKFRDDEVLVRVNIGRRPGSHAQGPAEPGLVRQRLHRGRPQADH